MNESLEAYLKTGWQYSHSQYIEEWGRIIGEVKWYASPSSSSWLVLSPDLGDGPSLHVAPLVDTTHWGGMDVGSGIKYRKRRKAIA